MIKTVKLSTEQRMKLIHIRNITGIKYWNVMCRWALCISLANKNSPPPYNRGGKVEIELDWNTLTDKDSKPVYDAINNLLDEKTLYSHFNRGIDFLVARDQENALTGQ